MMKGYSWENERYQPSVAQEPPNTLRKEVATMPDKVLLRFAMVLIVGGLLMLAASGGRAQSALLRSSDGRYDAVVVQGRSPRDLHYQVREVKTGRVLLTTRAQYESENDVKAGAFSADSKMFCAAYHYGHRGKYTWIGTWEIERGREPVRDREESEWLRKISCP